MLPWFRDPSSSPPYKIIGKMPAHKSWQGKCYDAVAFPWTRASLDDLCHSHSKHVVDPACWAKLISDFEDAVILIGKTSARMIHTRDFTKPMLCLKIPEAPKDDRTVISTDHVQATWVLNPEEEPELYIVLAYARLIYIYNVHTGKIVTQLRGHGGSITSLNTHPVYPQIFCSTSRDFTTRIYRLDREPKQKPRNPPWPPSRRASMAGPAHGLDMTEPEGFPKKGGLGRCVCVLVGGQAGGHNGDVLNAEFHPKLPLIVTCGVDRVIKIWYVPNPLKLTGERLLREDKPLFSSSRIHKARVHSVSWLRDDTSEDEILISYSAPAFMRREEISRVGEDPETDAAENYMEAGTVCLWKWLGRKRFFPFDHSKQDVLRGCPSDYQESSAFQFLSIHSLARATENHAPARMSLFKSPRHDSLILVTYPGEHANVIHAANISKFQRRRPLPVDTVEDNILGLSDQLANRQLPELEGWQIGLPREWRKAPSASTQEVENLVFSRLIDEGSTIIGVGDRGTAWLWHRCTPSQVTSG